jgi:hypothetical protein
MPTFGYTTAGSTSNATNTAISYASRASQHTATTGDTLSSMSLHCDTVTGTVASEVGVYVISGTTIGAQVETQSLNATTTKEWVNVAFTTALTNALDYTTAHWKPGTTDFRQWFDDIGTDCTYDQSLSLPATWAEDGFFDRTFSVYATYTAAGASISASDAIARRGQTDYQFTLSGGDATPGTATISDGVNTDSITITTYNGNGVNTCTIPSDIDCLYDATAVLTFTDAVSGTPTAAVSFQPDALNSYIDLVSPVATDDGYAMYHYTGAGTPITGWQWEWVTLTAPSAKTITGNADSGMIISSSSTVNETINSYMINASGVRSAADLVTFQFVALGVGSSSLSLGLGGFGKMGL